MKLHYLILAAASLLHVESVSQAEVKVAADHSAAGRGFAFNSVPAPATNDAATDARFTLVDGEPDQHGGGLGVLHDGRVPSEEDQPSQNFFFRAGTHGGRILIDLGRVISVKQVGTYSWHSGTRAPQVYKLYAADGVAGGFKPEPNKDAALSSCGWRFIAAVDTRPNDDDEGGQHGVAITEAAGALGKFRYLLLDVAQTEDRDAFGNTFYSEIDVIDASGPAPTTIAASDKPILKSFEVDGGKFRFTIDATSAPDLAEWAEKELQPVVQQWYPKIVAMLPSDGFQAPKNVTLRFRDDLRGVPASASGAGVNLNSRWFRGELQGGACGAVVHEMVHVVQAYGRASRTNSDAIPTPGWIVEGIADYIRWFLYEPQTKGAEITKNNLAGARYDSSYRVTGNFLDWITHKYDERIVRQLNAAAREGRYAEQLWEHWTGKTVRELGDEWLKFHEQRLQGLREKEAL